MAMNRNGKFGKDRPSGSEIGYIDHSLKGGSGPSNDVKTYPVDRPNQSIKTSLAMDNVKLAMPIDSSIEDMSDWPGGVDNISHSLTGSSAVNEEVGAAGKVKHIILPDH